MESQVFNRWRETTFDGNLFILICLPITVLLHNAACFGFWCGVIVFSCYLTGAYCCRFVTNKRLLSDRKGFQTNATINCQSSVICSKVKLNQQAFASHSIDEALDQIFCRIADQYISTWYSHISSDTWFQFEVRSAIGRIVRSLYDRIARINLEHFVLDKVVPICLAHAHVVTATRHGQNLDVSRLHVAVHSRKSEILYVQNLSKCVLKFLLPTNDFNCKSYVILLREIISKSVMLSLSDAICNPCVLNQLILHYLELGDKNLLNDGADGGGCDHCNDQPIKLLQNFADTYKANANNGFLRPDVNAILKDTELQNTFMRYLRSRNAEHVLQFCLDIASFNEKILKPELEAEQLDDLYRDAWDLFSVYFSSYSPNCIHFHKDLASPLRKALSKDILKLRTTATLFEAYEYAFSILENHCQDFHYSAEFYRWLYGQDFARVENSSAAPKPPPPPPPPSPPPPPPHSVSSAPSSSSSTVQSSASKEIFGRKTIAEIGQKFSKIKDVLKADSVLDGRLYYGGSERNGACVVGSRVDGQAPQHYCTEVGVDVQLAAIVDSENINKWKIFITTISTKTDPVTNNAFQVLNIQVTNENNVKWMVERRPVDIHSLNTKLKGVDLQLPTLNLPTPTETTTTTTTTTKEIVQVYEQYMKKLMQCVRSNDAKLLCDFLTCDETFGIRTVTNNDVVVNDDDNDNDNDDDDDDDDDDDVIEDDDIVDYENEEHSFGRIFCESALPTTTLRKERGQNIETFVNSLINSCTIPRYEWKEKSLASGDKKCANKKSTATTSYLNLKSTLLYGNNFDVDANKTRETVLACKSANVNANANVSNQTRRFTPFSLVIYVAYKIYNLRVDLVRILLCLKSVFGNLADQFIFKITSVHLKKITKQPNVAYFINTIEWAVFDNKIKYDEQQIREKLTKLLVATNDNLLYSAYQLIFRTIQDAKKNKQLFYNLCDALIEELFPEIFAGAPS